jgi:hypothetical protein
LGSHLSIMERIVHGIGTCYRGSIERAATAALMARSQG